MKHDLCKEIQRMQGLIIFTLFVTIENLTKISNKNNNLKTVLIINTVSKNRNNVEPPEWDIPEIANSIDGKCNNKKFRKTV